ncbi:CBS domain-containing protein [Streptomyces luteogriseus]|uniref:CBS domain-containing protein n=1 Tax=Streptomyces luteogriseus TaxID=68233 RepID=A0A7W7DXM2_9ACTN|nr:CBS domain-containing protein [Streptomyces luteogriseus]MBB4717387.1 CBS domain-containing protein [Streptomyces luteogriseus]
MAQYVRDIMTGDPVTVEPQTSVAEVARIMRDEDLGAVLVTDGDRLRGVVTDRDIVVRTVSRGGDPERITVAAACSDELVTVGPDEGLAQAVELMREHSVRRVPVVDHGRPVGIVSLGDLAMERDPESALGDISAARPNA